MTLRCDFCGADAVFRFTVVHLPDGYARGIRACRTHETDARAELWPPPPAAWPRRQVSDEDKDPCVECDDSREIPDDDGVTRPCPWCAEQKAEEGQAK